MNCDCNAGEVTIVVFGAALFLASVVLEAVRLTLMQVVLQSKDSSMDAVSLMFHIAPICFMALLVPCIFLEVSQVLARGAESALPIGPGLLSCLLALGKYCTCRHQRLLAMQPYAASPVPQA
jgi:hypothetical protein